MSGGLEALTPSVRFPITICVLSYGANVRLAERFLTTLYGRTNLTLFKLRAGLNQIDSQTEALYRSYAQEHGNIEITQSSENLFKSGMMRRLFHEKFITTEWTIWCDDDTHFTKAGWLQALGLKIESFPRTAMWGWIHVAWTNSREPLEFATNAVWHRKHPFLKGTGVNGRRAAEFRFATGGFWAIRTELIYKLNWPDPRLKQGGDDIMLGEALRQNGYKIGNFRHGVAINAAPRRNPDAPEHRTLGF